MTVLRGTCTAKLVELPVDRAHGYSVEVRVLCAHDVLVDAARPCEYLVLVRPVLAVAGEGREGEGGTECRMAGGGVCLNGA